jgi:predicted nucleotidyltransferase
VQPIIHSYLEVLESLQGRFEGIYIYGSVALDAYEEGKSDIDIVALTHGELTASELEQLEEAHKKLLEKQPLAKRLEISYVPLPEIGKNNKAIKPYPHFQNGIFSGSNHGDLNAVTWWTIKNRGICILGTKASALPIKVDWEDVLGAMRYNLNTYWAGKTKRAFIFLADYWVEFAVTTLCRILTTVEEGEIISKSVALDRWEKRLPARFQPLIIEAKRIQQQSSNPSIYRNRIKRMMDTLAFIKYVRERLKATN